jgi:uncharacterized protein YkwD
MRTASGARARRRSVGAGALAIVIVALIVLLVDGRARTWVRDRAGSSRVPVAAKPLVVGPELRIGPTSSPNPRHDPWKHFLASEATCPRGSGPAREEQQAVCLLNYARRRAGLSQLPESPLLSRAARLKARDIVRCHQFAHTACGRNAHAVADDVGYPRVAWGENIYLGTGPYAPPRLAVDGWLNSRGHRENLFRSEWTEQGIAVVHVNFGGRRDVAIWVSEFGARAPSS